MVTIGLAWRNARATRASSHRTSVVLALVTWLAANLPAWSRVRSAVMQTSACAAIDVGLFQYRSIAGWIGVGVSLFVLEALSGERPDRVRR